jgi:hypothetical protein
MRFSDYFKIKRTQEDDWFDPILSVDTPLFMDPFLVYRQEEGLFQGSHKDTISFFNEQFKLIAQAKGDQNSILYKKAVLSLIFPEVSELCLGYTSLGTKGAGSSKAIANVVAGAIWEAIRAGITEVSHFEEIALLREGFGADRISDMTAGILRTRLAQYTASICSRHHIPIQKCRYHRDIYDFDRQSWALIEVNLPFNKWNERPILLVPQKYLRELPTINADDFWDYCFSNENDLLRTEYSDDVTKNVDKLTIIDFARRHSEIRAEYLNYVEDESIAPYDMNSDNKGYVRWYDASANYCRAYPLFFAIKNQEAFLHSVEQMVEAYCHFIEENQGHKLLWNDNGKSKSEKAAQLLFLGTIKQYCQANDIDISPEANIGRGPVDFKLSKGFTCRALLEVKLARNTRFWNGLTRQLPTYINAEGIQHGYFIVIAYTDEDLKRISDIQTVADQVSAKLGYSITVVVVDAMPNKPSASRL